MDKTVTVFILAAGLGERLRPITNHIPKSLLPILVRPVLELILEKVSPFANTIGINLHHKKELITEYINNSPFKEKVNIFYEEPILGTGGALKNAEALLSKGTFLVHNGDILSDMDLGKLIEFHCSSKNIATLAVHNCPQFNSLEMDGNGLLKGIRKPPPLNPLPSPRLAGSREGKQMVPSPFAGDTTSLIPSPLVGEGQGEGGNKLKAFTGIAVYEPEFLNFLPIGLSSVIDVWMRAIDAGHKIGTMDVSGCYWTDIGTPSAYASAVVNALRTSGETIYVSPDVECGDIEIDGYVAIEKGGRLSGIKSLRNCIVLPEFPLTLILSPEGRGNNKKSLSIEGRENYPITPSPLAGEGQSLPPKSLSGGEGDSYENCIICQDIKIDLNESEMLGFQKNEDVLIGVGGSDRRYYRRRKNKQTEVFVRYAQNDADFHRHIEFTEFFRKHNIPVPELIAFDPESRTAVFEDLGDLSLYSWLKCKRETSQIEEMYKKVLHILVELHTTATGHVAECPSLQERVFDYSHARWETDYFMEEFGRKIKGIGISNMDALNEEFHRLAQKVDSFPKTIIHRDFQSQNIMVKKGAPRLIDYQGARIGPPAYDVASILWDPYFRLDDSSRETLLHYYISQMKHSCCTYPPLPSSPLGGEEKGEGDFRDIKRVGNMFNESEFIESLKICRVQRHMQALGAYGFLSSKKGKEYFLKHIPEGLRLLKEDILAVKSEYPALFELISWF